MFVYVSYNLFNYSLKRLVSTEGIHSYLFNRKSSHCVRLPKIYFGKLREVLPIFDIF